MVRMQMFSTYDHNWDIFLPCGTHYITYYNSAPSARFRLRYITLWLLAIWILKMYSLMQAWLTHLLQICMALNCYTYSMMVATRA